MVRRNARANEVAKSKTIDALTKEAADAYARIITRYPAMDRAVDAKARLEALHQPVPRPTRKALEQNQKEVASRLQPTMMTSMLGGLEKRPDVSHASHVGDPTMQDPEPETATKVVRDLAKAINGGGDAKIAGTLVKADVGPNQAPPRSDETPAAVAPGQEAATTPTDVNELKPNVAADANELKPNVEASDPNALPALQQSNQLAGGSTSSSSVSSSQAPEEMADISTSKKKKKKGIGKLNPF
jgi:outer membrane protein assembly factor BamD